MALQFCFGYELVGDALVGVVFEVLEDTDRRLGRVTVLVERDRPGVSVVVDSLALVEELGTLGERRALYSTGFRFESDRLYG